MALTQRRTKADWGHLLIWMADEAFPSARQIHLACDNLSIPPLGAVYWVLLPAGARRRAERFCSMRPPSMPVGRIWQNWRFRSGAAVLGPVDNS